MPRLADELSATVMGGCRTDPRCRRHSDSCLRDTARRFLEAEAHHLGVPLDPGSVMAHRAEGVPELHITGAADEMLKHLMGAGENVLIGEEGRLHDAGTDRRAGDHDLGRAGIARSAVALITPRQPRAFSRPLFRYSP